MAVGFVDREREERFIKIQNKYWGGVCEVARRNGVAVAYGEPLFQGQSARLVADFRGWNILEVLGHPGPRYTVTHAVYPYSDGERCSYLFTNGHESSVWSASTNFDNGFLPVLKSVVAMPETPEKLVLDKRQLARYEDAFGRLFLCVRRGDGDELLQRRNIVTSLGPLYLEVFDYRVKIMGDYLNDLPNGNNFESGDF